MAIDVDGVDKNGKRFHQVVGDDPFAGRTPSPEAMAEAQRIIDEVVAEQAAKKNRAGDAT